MADAHGYLKDLLANLRTVRERAGLSQRDLEDRLILGVGWIDRFESGETVPSMDMVLAILHETGARFEHLIEGLGDLEEQKVERFISAEEAGQDIVISFRYAKHEARYTLSESTIADFGAVVKTLRDGLARLVNVDPDQSKAIKTESVVSTFLAAVSRWPDANPSDLWWFIVYRAYCDPYNHPAQYARLQFSQSWKRTGGWALEEILVRHYGQFLKTHGVNLFIADGAAKRAIVESIDLADRIEPDKIDVVLTGDTADGPVFFGVVHVKASFAERRTDDVPMSVALIRAGYTSPLWTMDCKSSPADRPVNRGELGNAHGRRSAKRRDIEDEGHFTGCFSYNRHTQPSPVTLPPEQRIFVCDFSNADDQFSQFILQRWQGFQQR